MSETFRKWLKPQVDQLVTVQASTYSERADLVIQLWSGVKIHVHLIQSVPKPRNLKRTLQDATGAGIGTIFVVAAGLLPPVGQRLELPEWMQSIHELTSDRIYAYALDQNANPVIFQVHFEPVNGVNKVETTYGPMIKIERIRFFKTSVRSRTVRGDWLVADFVNPAFWKTHAYREAKARSDNARRNQRTYNTNKDWFEWSAYQTWSGNYEEHGRGSHDRHQSTNGALKAYLDICYERLGVENDADHQTVKRAFRKLALQLHPDVSNLPKAEAESRFKALTEAYEYIKTARRWS
jgi:hypothetical protein